MEENVIKYFFVYAGLPTFLKCSDVTQKIQKTYISTGDVDDGALFQNV